MSVSASTTTSIPQSAGPRSDSRPSGLVAQYRLEHRHPVNHFLHVGVGWPLAAVAVVLLPFKPLWSIGLILAAYAIMFFGHFAFERNTPTIFKHPSTPFVMAYSVIRGLIRIATRSRTR